MTWPMGMALGELFGFYDFELEPGKKLTGFSKDKGTAWSMKNMSQEAWLPLVLSASKAWQRRQKSGGDIGTLTHAAIEAYITNQPFDMSLSKYEEGQEFESDDQRVEWLKTAAIDFEKAVVAFTRFKQWWEETTPTLINAEQIIYSKEFDYPGAYDALLEIDGKTVLVDWKTSNASVSAGAPQGVYYSYFIQSAAYALALLEMGAVDHIDDLMIVSVRKDGQFNTVSASDVQLSVAGAIDWWKSVVNCYKNMDQTKRALVQLANQT